jgi:hypothetical protein
MNLPITVYSYKKLAISEKNRLPPLNHQFLIGAVMGCFYFFKPRTAKP